MIADSLDKTQSAYAGQLLADSALTTALGGARVYDAVPHSQSFPYVVLGSGVARDWSGQGTPGSELTLAFDVYSRSHGRSEVAQLAGLVSDALTASDPSVSGYRVVLAEVTRIETDRLKDAKTYRARITLRVLVEPA
ncbi:MAG: DUF3168 domain-containing protein [Rhodobiaceae bacterium]|nr:DUF3168 domain-containing protein [Rhodobiaceae bacterium]MCC0051084.1 DUF3168 domain-containing protein [Rhodobiaceae bacterium]MCC0060069.1 DUF3168 domain-containing protein [Rhodobiaceae bacterium]